MTPRLASPAPARDADAPRGQPRRKVFLPVSLRLGDERHRAHILNISTGGACLHARCPLTVDQPVSIDLDHRVLQGRVSWVVGERSGVRFVVPLSAAEVERLVG